MNDENTRKNVQMPQEIEAVKEQPAAAFPYVEWELLTGQPGKAACAMMIALKKGDLI